MIAWQWVLVSFFVGTLVGKFVWDFWLETFFGHWQ